VVAEAGVGMPRRWLGRSFVARTMRPGERPTGRLANAIDGDLATPEQTIDAFLARHRPAERVLVFIDQLEELFTLTSDDERATFLAVLRALRAEPLHPRLQRAQVRAGRLRRQLHLRGLRPTRVLQRQRVRLLLALS